MQVVEEEHQRAAPGDRDQERHDRLVEPETLLLGAELRWRDRRAEALRDLRQQRGQDGGTRADLVAQPVGRGGGDILAEHLEEGEIGRHPLGLRRAPTEHRRVRRQRRGREFLQQPRLADAGRPGEEDDRRSPGARLGKLLGQGGALAVAPDQRRAADAQHGWRTGRVVHAVLP